MASSGDDRYHQEGVKLKNKINKMREGEIDYE